MLNDVVGEFEVEEMKKKSIIEIFNEMEYEEEFNKSEVQKTDKSPKNYDKVTEEENELLEFSKIKREPILHHKAIEEVILGQSKWEKTSAIERADALHKVWGILKECSKNLSKSKNDILVLLDYFDFYSDLSVIIENDKNLKPQGPVLLVLSNHSPSLVLGATVAAALAAGNAVLAYAPEKARAICIFLSKILGEAGLHEELFNVVTNFNEDDIPVSCVIEKVFFCGSYLSAQKYYAKNLSISFNYLCPNNTVALILESSDLNSAADKIVQATWGENTFFAVSTVVVQESVYDNFMRILKCRIEQFMIENKNSSIFKDVIMSEKINKIILETLNAGAIVEKSCNYENMWSPTVIVNYQNQNIEEDAPVLKVLICRTAKEGTTLINNCRFSLGVSIWSEISSQALETSSMLICSNIWINCHGVFQASEPLQPSAFSGNCILGGSDGILEYKSYKVGELQEAVETNEGSTITIDKIKALQMSALAQQAMSKWQNIKEKRTFIKLIADKLSRDQELSKFSNDICTYAYFSKLIYSEQNSSQEFLVLKKKVPVGVILMIFEATQIDLKLFITLITFAIVLGNGVIIVLKNENLSIEQLIKYYNSVLPRNLLTVITGIKAGTYMASDPNIQAIWLIGEPEVSKRLFLQIRRQSAKSLKHIWVVPKDTPPSLHVFQRKCLRNKVVWLTSIDQFP